jgi:autotransporter-associated beta strand protein
VLSVYRGATFAAYGGGVYLARGGSGDNGQLNVRGGAVHLRGAGAALYIGYKGSGTVDVSDGGVLDVLNGTIVAVPKDQDVAGRTGTLRVTDGGTVKARTVYSDTAVSTAAIVLDGGNVVANAGSATNDLIYGFTSAAVGVGGATIDTNGQDKRISQSFAARTGTGQSVPTAESAAQLASLPAFTKVGAGTLSLTGENGWSCATCVSNGTLSVASGALPATTLRLGGGVIDICGASHTVAHLIGFGVVSNGTLTVTGTVWPGADGAGVLKIDATASVALSAIGCRVGPQGTCGLLDVDGTLDISGVRLLGENLAGRNADRGLTLVRARALTGRPATLRVWDLGVTVDGARLRLGVPGTTIILR